MPPAKDNEIRMANRSRVLASLTLFATCALSQDAREIVRRSVELDQNNWVKRADYTWIGHSRERRRSQACSIRPAFNHRLTRTGN